MLRNFPFAPRRLESKPTDTLIGAANESFEISSLREVKGRRVIGSLGEDPEDLSVAACVKRSSRHDHLKEGERHETGAGKGEENPSRLEKLESKEVDILVPPAAAAQLTPRFDKFGGIQDNEVKQAARVAEIAKNLEDVSVDVFEAIFIEVVEFPVLICQRESSGRGINVRYLYRAGLERMNAESPGVGEGVKHLGALRIVGRHHAVFSLVEVATCFLAVLDVYEEPAIFFPDHEK